MSGECSPKHVTIITKIIEKCQSKIEWSLMNINHPKKGNVVSPVKLVNAKYISLRCLYFFLVWTNKCEALRLHWIKNICKKWCNFVLNNCDCSNIKSLCLCWVTFLKNDVVNNTTTNNKIEQRKGQEILKQFTQFVNDEHLIIDFDDLCDDVLLLFYKYLKTMNKNNIKIQLKFDDNFQSCECRKLYKYIEEIDIGSKIHSIMFSFEFIGKYENIHSTFKTIKKMLTTANLSVERIKLETENTLSTVIDSIIDYINPMTFKSLNVFDYCDISKTSVQIVNKNLQIEFNKLSKSKLLIIKTHNRLPSQEQLKKLYEFNVNKAEKTYNNWLKSESYKNTTVYFIKDINIDKQINNSTNGKRNGKEKSNETRMTYKVI